MFSTVNQTRDSFGYPERSEGRENLRRLGDALFRYAKNPAGSFCSGQELISAHERSRTDPCGELASGYPFRLRIFGPYEFAQRVSPEHLLSRAQDDPSELRRFLPTLLLHNGDDSRSVQFFDLCLKLASEGILFIAQADEIDTHRALKDLYAKQRPANFIVP
jgi:hypothetical protein